MWQEGKPKTAFENVIARDRKTSHQTFFTYNTNRKSARDLIQPLDSQGVKGILKDDGERAIQKKVPTGVVH